jgi:hypothetical protein
MASFLKNILVQKYSTPHEFAVFAVLGGLCPSSAKNDKETLEDSNKTPPRKRFCDRNADGRFGHFRSKKCCRFERVARNMGKVTKAFSPPQRLT